MLVTTISPELRSAYAALGVSEAAVFEDVRSAFVGLAVASPNLETMTNAYEAIMARTNPHHVLGVPVDASTELAKKKYRELSLKYHPDRNPGNPAITRVSAHINEAYETVIDPQKMAKYRRMAEAIADAERRTSFIDAVGLRFR